MSKPTLKKRSFKSNFTHLPLTMEQFEEFTNEILTALNELCAPHFLEADYVAQVLMSAIHALKHETGYIEKSTLFEGCVNRISCHVTYHVVEEIQKKLKAKSADTSTDTDTISQTSTDNVTTLEQEAIATAH